MWARNVWALLNADAPQCGRAMWREKMWARVCSCPLESPQLTSLPSQQQSLPGAHRCHFTAQCESAQCVRVNNVGVQCGRAQCERANVGAQCGVKCERAMWGCAVPLSRRPSFHSSHFLALDVTHFTLTSLTAHPPLLTATHHWQNMWARNLGAQCERANVSEKCARAM
jgi:hypothetical protein